MSTIQKIIEEDQTPLNELTPESRGPTVDAVFEAMRMLNCGQERIVIRHQDGTWGVQQWLKRAIMMYFRLRDFRFYESHPQAFDKIPLKFIGWDKEDYAEHKIRVVPGAVIRYGSFIGEYSVVMPSFVNIGVYIGTGTMIDSYATIGSCAQIGTDVHVASSVVIGGVLEPLNSQPVIVEDNVFIGAHCNIVEGIHIGEGAVLGMGLSLSKTIPIVDRMTGEKYYGWVPPYSVVVPGTIACRELSGGSRDSSLSLSCGVIVKKVSPETRARTEINELLRS